MNKHLLSNSNDINSVAQSINAALDSFMQKFPIQSNQIQQLTRNKIISYTSIIKEIISGHGDELWNIFEKDIDKQLDEVKRSNLNLKGKQGKLASSLVKIEKESNENRLQDPNEIDKSVLLKKIEAKDSTIDNINAEILQLEAENEALQVIPLPAVKPPTTAEKNARISLKQKQQEFSSLNSEYDKMRRDFSIQIQQNTQGLEKSKRDVEKLEMQINAIQSRINLMNRAGNIPKRSLQETSRIPKLPDINRANGSNLPNLSLSIHSNVISPDQTDESDLVPTLNNDFLMNGENNIPRKPSSQPQQSLKELAFNRYSRPIKISISDTENSQQQQQQKANRIQRTRISTAEMDKTDKCLQEMSAAFLEAEEFLKEINAFDENNDNQPFQNEASKSNEKENTSNNQVNIENSNNESKAEFENITVKPKVVTEPKSSPSTPSYKRIPMMPKTPNNSSSPRNQKRKDDISFMPISEEEMKKVARPLTCNDSEKPRRIPVNLREGYELVFFHIAERVPKLV